MIARSARDTRDYPTFVESLKSFITSNGFAEVVIVADAFMKQAAEEAMLKARVEDYSDHVIERL